MSDFYFALTAIVCFLSALAAAWNAHRAEAALSSLRARVRSCESHIESLRDSLDSTQTSLTSVANRLKMTKVRNAAEHVREDDGPKREPGEPDSLKDPDGWRRWKNAQIHEQVFIQKR